MLSPTGNLIPASETTVASAPKKISQHLYPRLRWLALAWLVIYIPSYGMAYGAMNFLFLCNLGVIITAYALLNNHQLLISSQAIASPVIGLVWGLDAGARLLTGSFLFGGTEYMWDPQYPLWTRVLSLYHLVWPVLVVWCVKKNGYDRRGWPLQVGITGITMLLSRLLTEPQLNVNFSYTDPFFGLQLGPAPLHLAIITAAMGVFAYGLTHLLLTRALKCPPTSLSSSPKTSPIDEPPTAS